MDFIILWNNIFVGEGLAPAQNAQDNLDYDVDRRAGANRAPANTNVGDILGAQIIAGKWLFALFYYLPFLLPYTFVPLNMMDTRVVFK